LSSGKKKQHCSNITHEKLQYGWFLRRTWWDL